MKNQYVALKDPKRGLISIYPIDRIRNGYSRIPFPIRHWKTPKFTQFFAPDEQKAPELLRGPSVLLLLQSHGATDVEANRAFSLKRRLESCTPSKVLPKLLQRRRLGSSSTSSSSASQIGSNTELLRT